MPFYSNNFDNNPTLDVKYMILEGLTINYCSRHGGGNRCIYEGMYYNFILNIIFKLLMK